MRQSKWAAPGWFQEGMPPGVHSPAAPRRSLGTVAGALCLMIGLMAPLLGACSMEPGPTALPTQTDVFDSAWGTWEIYASDWRGFDGALPPALQGATEYRIEIAVSENLERIQGSQRLRYTHRDDEPATEIFLRLFPNIAGGELVITNITVDGEPVEPVLEAQGSSLRVPLQTPLRRGDASELALDFELEIPRTMAGNYGLFGYFEGVLVLDTFYPMVPVFEEGRWHAKLPAPKGDLTFNDASFYLVRVHAPEALVLVGSGVEIERDTIDGKQVVTYAAGPARDFYLAASPDFRVWSAMESDVQVNSYAPEEREARARQALEIGAAALRSFERHFGPYPYREMDLAATPMKALGIEYPGMMGIAQSLYDPEAWIRNLPSAVYFESTVAHEVAHQWFYNLVGNDQSAEPWLDEAMAQYATYLYFLDTYGEQAAEDYWRSWEERWGRVDRADIPIGLPAAAYEGAAYGAIVYGRGPLFLQELREAIGEQVFAEFLHRYTAEHAWRIATAESFKLLVEETCQCDLTPLFEAWVWH